MLKRGQCGKILHTYQVSTLWEPRFFIFLIMIIEFVHCSPLIFFYWGMGFALLPYFSPSFSFFLSFLFFLMLCACSFLVLFPVCLFVSLLHSLLFFSLSLVSSHTLKKIFTTLPLNLFFKTYRGNVALSI